MFYTKDTAVIRIRQLLEDLFGALTKTRKRSRGRFLRFYAAGSARVSDEECENMENRGQSREGDCPGRCSDRLAVERSVGGCEPGNRNPERRAAHVI